ncbi:MAG: uroporphyrinogen decarboxylase family protein [Planctomycetota bacterium]
MALKHEPLTREEVKAAVRGEDGGGRPPAFMHKWPGEGLRELHGDALQEVFDRYPDDVLGPGVVQPGSATDPEGFPEDYTWGFREAEQTTGPVARDAGGRVIRTWQDLDPFLEHLSRMGGMVRDGLPICHNVEEAVRRADGRYVLARAWNYFYERLWMLRGMQNLLMDFHLHPREVHRLCDGLLEFALELLERAARAGADGFSSSNDLGHQTGLMMGPGPFREFLKPRLAALAEASHQRGMEFWLHSCGDLTDIVDDLAEIGVDCLHPIQYGAMDWAESARRMNGRMTAWAGADVQHVLPEAPPREVRRHVRRMIDTFYRPGAGRLVVAAGNGIIAPTTLENIDAFLDECFRYGRQKAG